MSKVYFISDPHFGHENMAKHRGFENADAQDSFIIDNWNKTVSKKDTVWLLGDITMEKSNYSKYLPKLNGLINVVCGNHDLAQHTKELSKFVNKIGGAVKYKGFILTHIPIHESEINRFRGNIHGHVHEKSLSHVKYLNVSCEVLGYKPILFEDLLATRDKNDLVEIFEVGDVIEWTMPEDCGFDLEGKTFQAKVEYVNHKEKEYGVWTEYGQDLIPFSECKKVNSRDL
jgi:calcineurin-like phosphoesterase family protein